MTLEIYWVFIFTVFAILLGIAGIIVAIWAKVTKKKRIEKKRQAKRKAEGKPAPTPEAKSVDDKYAE